MHKYKLRFKDEAESLPVLAQLPRLTSHAVILGEHTRYHDNPDDPDNPIPEKLEGWHVDVVSREPMDFLLPYAVTPEHSFHEIA